MLSWVLRGYNIQGVQIRGQRRIWAIGISRSGELHVQMMTVVLIEIMRDFD